MKTILCFAFAAFSFALSAQTLDITYANNGVLINPNPSIFGSFALQSSGKLIVAGPQGKTEQSINDFVLARYNTKGVLDSSFGKNGMVADADSNAQVFDAAIQQDDAIIAAAQSHYSGVYAIKLKRFKKNGDVDMSFGKNGFIIFSIGINSSTYEGDIVVQADGRILMCGSIYTANQTKFGFLARFLPDGSLDKSFSDDGVATWNNLAQGNSLFASSVALQKNGKALVCWFSSQTAIVYRFTTSGVLDNSFGVAGAAEFKYSDGVAYGFLASKLVVQKDDKIIGSGYATNQSGSEIYLAASRLNADGSLDNNYGNGGLQHITFNGKSRSNGAAALQNNGKLIVAGTISGSKKGFGMTRLNNNGTIDSAFGDRGTVITEFDKYTECDDILIQDNNKIILGGTTGLTSDNVLIARYINISTGKENIANTVLPQNDNLLISLSPNPAKNNLQISGLKTNQQTKLTVVDFTGNIKLQTVINSNSYNLNIASLKPGNYLLKIQGSNEVITKQFIKE